MYTTIRYIISFLLNCKVIALKSVAPEYPRVPGPGPCILTRPADRRVGTHEGSSPARVRSARCTSYQRSGACRTVRDYHSWGDPQ